MISEISPNWAGEGTQHPTLENRSDREQERERRKEGANIYRHKGGPMKRLSYVSLMNWGVVQEQHWPPTPCSLLALIPLSLSGFHYPSVNLWVTQWIEILKTTFGFRWWHNRCLWWLRDLVWNIVANERMALCERCEGCERRRRGIYKGLSKGLIYEHPDQWVN